MAEEKSLPQPDPELPKPEKDLPLPEKDLPAGRQELPAHSTPSKIKSKLGGKNPFWLVIIGGLVIAIIIATVFALFKVKNDMDKSNTQAITSYEECIAAGYPIMESYPEQCAVPGGPSFTRELTDEEQAKLIPISYSSSYVNEEYSFTFPDDIFVLAHDACSNNSPSPKLMSKNPNNKYSGQSCVYGIIFDVNVVDKVEDFDAACYSTVKEQILIDDKPATSFTAKFIGGEIEKCTEEMLGKVSDTHRYIYVENEDQMYLIKWPVQEYIDQSAYDQILSAFKFSNSDSEFNNQVYTNNQYGFRMTLPEDWTYEEKEENLFGNEIFKVTFQTPIIDSKLSIPQPAEVSVYENPNNLNLSAFSEDVFADKTVLKRESSVFNNINAIEHSIFAFDYSKKMILFPHKDILISVSYVDENPNDPNFAKNLATYTQILDSFELID